MHITHFRMTANLDHVVFDMAVHESALTGTIDNITVWDVACATPVMDIREIADHALHCVQSNFDYPYIQVLPLLIPLWRGQPFTELTGTTLSNVVGSILMNSSTRDDVENFTSWYDDATGEVEISWTEGDHKLKLLGYYVAPAPFGQV